MATINSDTRGFGAGAIVALFCTALASSSGRAFPTGRWPGGPFSAGSNRRHRPPRGRRMSALKRRHYRRRVGAGGIVGTTNAARAEPDVHGSLSQHDDHVDQPVL